MYMHMYLCMCVLCSCFEHSVATDICFAVSSIVNDFLHILRLLQPQFKEGMMPSFAHILLEVLVQKSHDLIREEVCLCLHAMAAVDFPLFHGETLPSFLSKCTQLREEQRTALANGYKMDQVGNSL